MSEEIKNTETIQPNKENEEKKTTKETARTENVEKKVEIEQPKTEENKNTEKKEEPQKTQEAQKNNTSSSTGNEVELLKKELSEANEKLNKINQQILYMKSDMDNLRKTISKDCEREIQQSSIKTIKEFLTVLDNFELCIDSEKKSGKTLPEGFEIIYKSFLKTLETLGIAETKNDGNFDPSIHEAINFISVSETNGKPAQSISSVLRKGYLYKGSLIRPTQVIVVKE